MVESWPFVGREELVRQVTSAIADGPGGAVLQGALGTGKTRLSEVVADDLTSRGWHVERCIGSAPGMTIPFGVVSHLAPTTLGSTNLTFELEQLRRRLLERARGSRLLLAIDDANLVDASSMALFLRLVAFREAAVLVTRRSGEAGNERAITSLWKDGFAELFEVEALDRRSHDRLVELVLGPTESGVQGEELWRLTQGNPLFLRELLAITTEDGSDLVVDAHRARPTEGDRWARLADIVNSKARRLTDREREALDVVAVAEPIRLELLSRLASPATLADLERQGMVAVDHLSGVEQVSTAHPIYGATLRATLPLLRRRAVCHSLAHALLAEGIQRPDDTIAAATWLLEAGEQPPTELAEAAARQALGRGDPRLADRLASAVVDRDEGVAGLVILGAARSAQHVGDGARSLFERALARAGDDRERVSAGIALARHVAWIERDPQRATELLEALHPTLATPHARAELSLELASLRAVGGNTVDTARAAGDALSDAGGEPELLLSALVWSTLARCMLGRFDDLEEDLERGRELAIELRATQPLALDQLQINRVMWMHVVDLTTAMRIASAGHGRAAREGGLVGAWAATQVLVLRDIGELDRALAVIRRGIAELERFDPFNNLPMVHALASHVHSLRGESEAAARWFDQMGPLERMEPRTRVHGDRARVWLTVHEPKSAAALAVAAGERAEAGTMVLWACPLYHDAVRLGVPQPAVAPLSRLAGDIDAPLLTAMSGHAQAAASRDAAALARVARVYESLGAHLLAAEALGQAAASLEPATRAAARLTLRALRLAACSPGAATPPLTNLVSPLSARETEIGTAAASGLTSREIAARLVLSARTVDNHLASIYRKLGLSSREELPSILGPPAVRA